MNIRTLSSVGFLVFLFFLYACDRPYTPSEPALYVDPFIGTDGHGHTYPGAATAFGMVQLSPQTRLTGWDGCSGYHYTDSLLYGFAHTALNGTGVSDYGDILIMPYIGEPEFSNESYRSAFKKENENAAAGYYSVYLEKPKVFAEMTATTRVGHHRYTFPESEDANFIIDLVHRDKVLDSWIEFVSDTEIRGMRRSSNWAEDMVWYFHMEFSKPFVRCGIAIEDELDETITEANGTHIKAYVGFNTGDGEEIEVKVSLSAVDADGAYQNMQAELPGWGFEKTRQLAYDQWNDLLGKVKTNGGKKEQHIVFYTAMYHAYLQPNTFIDVDGRYRGIDRNIHHTDSFTNYTVFSLWDTYRTWHPLMTILEPDRSLDFVKVMLNMYELGGLLPIWELAANETFCMIGNHSISVIVDAFMKGIREFNTEKALQAMLHSANQDHFGLDAYRKYGHIPGEKEHESISKTLEYAYNDWCIAMMANEMGEENIYREFIRRAQFYKNIFDPVSGFMRPRINGGWLTPFDPTTVDWHFTEANAWHYGFYVPQDITGFYELHGGKAQLAARLDELFETNDPITGRDMKDITGLIGQYAQGNEPSHHTAYMYNFLNQPWKTQQRVRQIMDELYTHKPDGLSGNEDCGQMSAWLIMSAMGFYPMTPGQPEYIIGTPWFPEMEIHLDNGNVFTITAYNVSERNIYIQSASLNGVPYTKSFIAHEDIMQGGHLHFEMGRRPNKEWGSSDQDVPKMHITDELLLPIPFIEAPDRRIHGQMEVSIGSIVPNTEIYYTLDGSLPDKHAIRYEGPIVLDQPCILTAVNYQQGRYSFPVEAEFVKIDLNRSIDIRSEWHPNYHGDGPEALIDGVRGSHNWRLGGWHGYQGTDFEAVVDLGETTQISLLGAGFIHEIRSWIWMPADLQFYVSEDGADFEKVAHLTHDIAADDYEVRQIDLITKVDTKARYIKVKAKNFGTIPSWHLGAGGDAYIFIDEIIIQ